MCTVSIVAFHEPGDGTCGYRLVCNRDESRSRPNAAAPRWRTIGDTQARALWPMDMEAGGTWIGTSEDGLTLSLLNLNDGPARPGRPRGRSRGLLIPDLLDSPDGETIASRIRRTALREFLPFRLIVTEVGPQAPRITEMRWDGGELVVLDPCFGPACFASSGLGDALVQRRIPLFHEMVLERDATPERQDEFHRHTWPDRPELSVMMRRPDARTVSVTTVEVCPGRPPTMAYEPIPSDAGVSPQAAIPNLDR